MRKTIKLSLLLIIAAAFLAIGCNTSSKLTPAEIGIKLPEPEPLGPVNAQDDFEETVKGKVWYTKLQGDESLDNLYQIKIQFNTSSKTFTKETYKWERYGRTDKYKYAGLDTKKANYFYGLAGNVIEYELTQDYFVNAKSSRLNNTMNKERQSALYGVTSPEVIIWDGHTYYVKQALDKHLIEDYTTKREFTYSDL